jgi:F-type H+-transporting ATPase subunit gamma
MMSQQLTVERLLPMELPKTKAETALDFKAEPENEPLLAKLLPQRLSAKFYEAVLESVASEQGARRNAMEAASDNAVEMIEKLTLLYNRERQAAITTEILEVVAGAGSQ